MSRPRLDPTAPLTAAERARRYRQAHAEKVNITRRKQRHAAKLKLPALPEGRLRVRLTQLDAPLPLLSLARLAAYHKARGDEVHFSRSPYRSPTEPDYDVVYGSAIFTYSARRVERFKAEFPGAVCGGTHDANTTSVEDIIGDFDGLPDFSCWPDFRASIGFTQRGCRLKCGFCVVPVREGKPRSVNTIADIWRGDPYPRHIHALDNDFFGQASEQWQARIKEIRDGKFKISFTQGVNIRLVDDEVAEALASIHYTDDQFKRRTLYCAWDNLKDEAVFFRGVDTLERAGVPPSHLMAYMLCGWRKGETWADLLHRFHKMADRGIKPFPMVYGDRRRTLPTGNIAGDYSNKTLGDFARWAIRRLYVVVPFAEYNAGMRGPQI
jgi:hypothetical protein